MEGILQYLKRNGQRFDSEIAAAMGISVEQARRAIDNLSADGEVMACHSVQFRDGKAIEGILCRVSGYIPPASPGRKPKR